MAAIETVCTSLIVLLDVQLQDQFNRVFSQVSSVPGYKNIAVHIPKSTSANNVILKCMVFKFMLEVFQPCMLIA